MHVGSMASYDGGYRHAPRTRYPSDVAADEWAFLAPYLTLMREDAPQRKYPLRERFNSLRFCARTGLQWRYLPHDLPPWHAVYQQTRPWIDAEVFETGSETTAGEQRMC